jgi:hypothetical protein
VTREVASAGDLKQLLHFSPPPDGSPTRVTGNSQKFHHLRQRSAKPKGLFHVPNECRPFGPLSARRHEYRFGIHECILGLGEGAADECGLISIRIEHKSTRKLLTGLENDSRAFAWKWFLYAEAARDGNLPRATPRPPSVPVIRVRRLGNGSGQVRSDRVKRARTLRAVGGIEYGGAGLDGIEYGHVMLLS